MRTARNAIVTLIVIVIGGFASVSTVGADATSSVTATSVTFDPVSASCSAGSMFLTGTGTGFNTSGDHVTTATGADLINGTGASGPPIPAAAFQAVPAQPNGTIMGFEFSLGNAPINAPQDAAWFVLYTCHPAPASVGLYTCFGPFGSCPHTAVEAMTPSVTVGNSTPAPGSTVDFTATGCYGTTGWAQLQLDGAPIETIEGLAVAVNGSFSGQPTVPGGIASGTSLQLVVGCGTSTSPLADETTVALVVVGATPVSAAPSFAG